MDEDAACISEGFCPYCKSQLAETARLYETAIAFGFCLKCDRSYDLFSTGTILYQNMNTENRSLSTPVRLNDE